MIHAISQAIPRVVARGPVPWLIAMSLFLHVLVSTSMQARYWYDTVVYFELARALFDADRLQRLYAGDFGILFAHVVPGVPTLIWLSETLLHENMWLGIATLQVLLNAVVLVWLARSFRSFIGTGAQFVFVAVVSLHPFFAAYHNAILTESIAASMWMLALGAFVRGLEGRLGLGAALAIMLASGFIGAQFRSYIMLFPAGASLILIYVKLRFARSWLYLLPIVAVAASVLAFPLYRASRGTGFFLTDVNPLLLVHASYVAWDLTPEQQVYLDGVVLDPDIRRRFIGRESVDYSDMLKIMHDLVAAGATKREASAKMGAAAFQLRIDNMEIIGRQLQSTLSSLGFQRVVACCSLEHVLRRHEANSTQGLTHLQSYYAWAAGIAPTNYADTFRDFLSRYTTQPNLYSPDVVAWYGERVGGHVTADQPVWRDPFRIGLASPDLLAGLGIIGIGWIFLRDWRIGAGFLIMLGAVYTPALLGSFVGDNRHSHVLLPAYIFLAVYLAGEVIRLIGLCLRRRNGV